MAGVMEIVVTAQDQASDVIEGIGSTAEDAGERVSVSWAAVGAASAAAGAAAEGFARSQQDATVELGRTSTVTGIAAGDLRALAADTANVTLSTDEVIGTFHALGRQGVRTQEDLQRVTFAWDMVADATGENVVALAEGSVALRALGIDATEPEKAMDALGFIVTNTTGSVGEFLQFVERTGPELRELGLDVNDTAAIMGVLENELGLTGRVARTEFREAVNQSNGDLGQMLELLGVSPESFDAMRESVVGSGEALQANAEQYAESFTPLQKLQAMVEETMLKYGGLAEAAGLVAPVLVALGPLLAGITTATRGLGVALSFVAANPVVLIIAAVAALAAGLVIAYKRSETFRNVVQKVFRAVGAAVKFMTAPFRAGLNAVFGGIEWLVNGAAGAINRLPRFTIPGWVPGIGGQSFGLPRIPTIRLPRLHDGGIFRAPAGQMEGLALLRDMERVVTPEQDSDMLRLLSRILALLERGIPVDASGVDEEMKRLIRKLFRTSGLSLA